MLIEKVESSGGTQLLGGTLLLNLPAGLLAESSFKLFARDPERRINAGGTKESAISPGMHCFGRYTIEFGCSAQQHPLLLDGQVASKLCQ